MSTPSIFTPLLRRAVPWTCHACRSSNQRFFATKPPANAMPKSIPKSTPKNKRRRRLIVAGGGLVLGATLVTATDDAKHAVTAVQRSSRVVSTLFININEYVRPYRMFSDRKLTTNAFQLSKNPQARPRRRLPRPAQSMPFAMRETNPPNPREERLDIHKAGSAS